MRCCRECEPVLSWLRWPARLGGVAEGGELLAARSSGSCSSSSSSSACHAGIRCQGFEAGGREREHDIQPGGGEVGVPHPG